MTVAAAKVFAKEKACVAAHRGCHEALVVDRDGSSWEDLVDSGAEGSVEFVSLSQLAGGALELVEPPPGLHVFDEGLGRMERLAMRCVGLLYA